MMLAPTGPCARAGSATPYRQRLAFVAFAFLILSDCQRLRKQEDTLLNQLTN